jgi:hypothetical protein
MPPDDPIERERRRREAEERRASRRFHPGAEDSDPPTPRRVQTATDWPPPSVVDLRPGAGNPSGRPPSIEATSKAFLGVWGVLAVIFGSAGAGWTAHAFFAKPLITATIKDEMKPVLGKLDDLQKTQDLNQRANEKSFASISTDIDWLKRDLKIQDTQPIKSEKPHR